MQNRILLWKILSAALFCLFLTTPKAFANIDVIFPISEQAKSVSDLHIIGQSDIKDPVVIEVNGIKTTKKLIESKNQKGEKYYMLMSILKLDPGENLIKVTQGKTVRTLKVTKVDSPVTIGDWTTSFQKFHSSSKREICLSCHKFENLSDCINCHRDKFIGKWVHAPVKQAKCFTCHLQEKSFIPQEPFSSTCLACHENFNTDLKKAEFVHGPVAAGFCTICHSPHKSTDVTHLRQPVNKLCDSCHASSDLGFNYHQKSYMVFHPVDGVFVDKLNKTLDCADCHTPHYSNDSMLLSTKEFTKEQLCSKCHDAEEAEELLNVLTDLYEETKD
jgi:predicted CXXCH cytochrome family protein